MSELRAQSPGSRPKVRTKSYLRSVLNVLAVLCGAAAATGPSAVEAQDYHALFEARCGSCHDHAGELARRELVIVGDRLEGRKTGADIRKFLTTHFGRLNAGQTAAIYDMLFRQAEAGGFFKERCGICHVRARDLARQSLFVADGYLRGRYSGRDMREFLPGHGRLDAAEATFIHDALLRITQGKR